VERKSSLPFIEFVVIVSMMMSLTALSIDAMLPALPQMGTDLGIANPNDRQLIISIIFLGQAFGQLFFGPLSDRVGRKTAIFAGYGLFLAGSLVSALAADFPMMLIGRTLQGLGVSAPRAVSLALIRDQFEGSRMARVMSFTMTVFIIVPMIAPALGQGIMLAAGWRSIFGGFIVFAIITVIWFGLRVPETLPADRRLPFTVTRITRSAREVLSVPVAVGYTIIAGLVYGAFTGYLNSSQQILQEQYALGESFPLFFAIIALSIGTASLLNARLVMRFGMSRLVRWALLALFGLALMLVALALATNGQPPLPVLMGFFMLYFFSTGIIFGNVNSLAMEPLGRKAGIGAAVVGSLSTIISMVLGMIIGGAYNGTILPLVIGMALLTGFANLVVRWVTARQLVEPSRA
jgi:DHA1 family bicyclomycin/chloramphenicol resistance-like MFS transporter